MVRGAVQVEDGGAYWSQALLRTQGVPSTSKLTTSDPTRTGDMGHVKHVSPVRRKSWEAVRGAVQVQDGESYWSHSHLRTKWAPSMPKLATSDPLRTGDSSHVTRVAPVQRKRWRAVGGAVQVQDGRS